VSNLDLLRKERGFTLEQVAAGIGISRQGLARIETTPKSGTGKNLEKLADFYGVSTDYILGREPAPGRPAAVSAPEPPTSARSRRDGAGGVTPDDGSPGGVRRPSPSYSDPDALIADTAAEVRAAILAERSSQRLIRDAARLSDRLSPDGASPAPPAPFSPGKEPRA